MNSVFWNNERNEISFSLKAEESLQILTLNSRNKIIVELNGAGASFEYRSLTTSDLGKFEQDIRIIHNAEKTKSFAFVRNILGGDSFSEYHGLVEAKRHCTEIYSRQLVNTLLLSEKAKAVAKPELKIYCDIVECSHGSTCGNLDRNMLFYLESRGIPPKEAERVIINAFAKEIAAGHADESQKQKFLDYISQAALC